MVGGLTRGMEDHLHTQRSQLCSGTTICYALDSHYFRAKLAWKSISWCQVYQTSMQTAWVGWGEVGGDYSYTRNLERSEMSSLTGLKYSVI